MAEVVEAAVEAMMEVARGEARDLENQRRVPRRITDTARVMAEEVEAAVEATMEVAREEAREEARD